MSAVATLVTRLIEAGAAPAVAAEVVVEAIDLGMCRSADVRRQSVESPTDIAAERRRNADKQRKREARAAEKLARTVCGQSADGADKRCDLSSLLTDSQIGIREASKKDTTSVVEGRTPRKATRLSEGSQISDADRQFARREGLTDAQIDRAWAEFVDYWIGVPGYRGLKTNWPGTWRNRVRAISSKQGGPNGHRSTGGARQSAGSDFFAGLEKVAANITGYSPMAGDGPEAIPLGRVNLDG